MNEKTYVAVAYRWGTTNAHQFVLCAGADREKIEAAAAEYPHYRGGKYGVAVYEFSGEPDDNCDQPSKQVAYYPSMTDEAETGPSHNPIHDVLQAVGHRVWEAVRGDGKVLLPTPPELERDPTLKTLTYQIADPPVPQWLKDEWERAEKTYFALYKRESATQAREGTPQGKDTKGEREKV